MTAFYNENDPFAAAWLRELMADNLIAPGVVDERSIEDITPDDLRPFQQCHFFAGIGVWSLAARLAGIPDDAPLWTGSCPCQPFSGAGKGEGFDDERHLWPAFHYLIEQCAPSLVVGEQVAGADGDAWFDLVSADLDATGYAFGAAETCAAGFGAPHKRQRNYWLAVAMGDDASVGREGWKSLSRSTARHLHAGAGATRQLADRFGARLEGFGGHGDDGRQSGRVGADAAGPAAARGDAGRLADSPGGRWREECANAGGLAFGDCEKGVAAGSGDGRGLGRLADVFDDGQRQHGFGVGKPASAGEGGVEERERFRPDPTDDGAAGGVDLAAVERCEGQRLQHVERGKDSEAAGPSEAIGLAGASGVGRGRRQGTAEGRLNDGDDARRLEGKHGAIGHNQAGVVRIERPGPVNGYWRDADWLRCRDEVWRPVRPGAFPLAPAGAVRNRVGLLRGAGNAVSIAQAEGFLVAALDAIGGIA